MSKLKAFIHVYIKSLTSIEYYKDIIGVKNAFSMKYFVILALLATTLITIKTSIPVIPEVKNVTNKFFEQISDIYPRELEIKTEKGEWSINQQEPYAIPTPVLLLEEVELEYRPEENAEKFPANLIIFDHNGTIDDLQKRDTLFVMNGANIIARGSNKIEVYPLSDLPDGTLDRAGFDSLIGEFRPIAKYVPFIAVLAILFGSMFYFFVYRMVYLSIVATIFKLISMVQKQSLDMSTLYRISIHTFTLPLTLEVLFTMLNITIPIDFWMFLVNLGFGIVVLNTLKKSTANLQ